MVINKRCRFHQTSINMIKHSDLSVIDLKRKIKQREISFGGNIRMKIYGTLQCKSGKHLKRENRVFFSSEKEAITNVFRPCGHCMRNDYQEWKSPFYIGDLKSIGGFDKIVTFGPQIQLDLTG